MSAVPILSIALFAAMVVVALWAWLVAPASRRFSARVGVPSSFDGTIGKRTGLVVWVALGGVVLAGSLVAGSEDELLAALAAPVLAFLLLMEIVSVRRLTR